jgi:hypothetical protein
MGKDEKAEFIFGCTNYFISATTFFLQPDKLIKMRGGHISSTVMSEFLLALEYIMHIIAECTLSPLCVSVGI